MEVTQEKSKQKTDQKIRKKSQLGVNAFGNASQRVSKAFQCGSNAGNRAGQKVIERVGFGSGSNRMREARGTVGWVGLRLDPGRMRGNTWTLAWVDHPKCCVLTRV